MANPQIKFNKPSTITEVFDLDKVKFIDDFMYKHWTDIVSGIVDNYQWITELETDTTIELLEDIVNGFVSMQTTLGFVGPYLTTDKHLIKGIQNNLFMYARFGCSALDEFVFYAVGFADETTKYYTGNNYGFWICYAPQLMPTGNYCFVSQTDSSTVWIYDTGITNDDQIHEWKMVSNNVDKLTIYHYNKTTGIYDENMVIDISELPGNAFMKPAVYVGYQLEVMAILSSLIMDVYYFEADRLHTGGE